MSKKSKPGKQFAGVVKPPKDTPATLHSTVEILPPGERTSKAQLLAQIAAEIGSANPFGNDPFDFDDPDFDDDAWDVPPQVDIMQLPHGKGLPLPSYQTEGSVGMDLAAAIAEGTVVTIEPGKRALIPTGLKISLPLEMEGQIRPRSGLALKYGVTVLNAPGTIDTDYRGEIGVLLINHGDDPFKITRGDRIAQIVFKFVARVDLIEDDDLDDTDRSGGGFGSTGT